VRPHLPKDKAMSKYRIRVWSPNNGPNKRYKPFNFYWLKGMDGQIVEVDNETNATNVAMAACDLYSLLSNIEYRFQVIGPDDQSLGVPFE
jgi:hypothetical protein